MDSLNTDKLKLGRVYICTFESQKSQDYCFVLRMAAEALGFEASIYHMNEQNASSRLEKEYKINAPYIPKIIFFLFEDGNDESIFQLICQKLHPHICLFTCKKNPKVEALYQVMQSNSFSSDLFDFENLEELHQKAKNSLIKFNNSRRSSIATVNTSGADIYTLSRKLINDAKHHVILCQNTSSLLLGARQGSHYAEQCFNDALWELPNKGDLDSSFTFTHIFSKKKTRDVIKSKSKSSEYDLDSAQKDLKEFILNAKFKCYFICINKEFPPFVIADFNLIFRLQLGDQKFNIELPHSISDLSHFKEQLQNPRSYDKNARIEYFGPTLITTNQETKENDVDIFLSDFYDS